jgi:hypothetical protein
VQEGFRRVCRGAVQSKEKRGKRRKEKKKGGTEHFPMRSRDDGSRGKQGVGGGGGKGGETGGKRGVNTFQSDQGWWFREALPFRQILLLNLVP